MTERSEASDYLMEASKTQTPEAEEGFQAWVSEWPCPDGGEARCPRCYIDYATHLAYKALLDA